jgi:parallel beta-helix repeat protein
MMNLSSGGGSLTKRSLQFKVEMAIRAGVIIFFLMIPSGSLAEPNETVQPVEFTSSESTGLMMDQETMTLPRDSPLPDTGLFPSPAGLNDESLDEQQALPESGGEDVPGNSPADALMREGNLQEQNLASGEPPAPAIEIFNEETLAVETAPTLPGAMTAASVPVVPDYEEPVSGSAAPLQTVLSCNTPDSEIPAETFTAQNSSPEENGRNGYDSSCLVLIDPPLNEGNLSGTGSGRYWEINTSGSYFLDFSGQSFETDNPFAVWIHASSVVLDGMGKGLKGKDAPQSSGILVDKLSMGIQIFNLTLEHWDTGILMDYSAPGIIDNIISGVTAENNTNGIVLVNSDETTIENCEVRNNHDNGVVFINADNNAITGCSVRNNQGNGIYLEYSDNALISGNRITGNRLAGVNVQNNTHPSDIARIVSNMIDHNQKGVLINGSLVDIIGNNRIEANGIGLEILNDSGNLIYDNHFIDNSNSGIFISNSYNGWIFNNYFNNRNNVIIGQGNRFTDWNVTLKEGPNIIGGPLLGGNYWADPSGGGYSQTCEDLDQNGICDAPYLLGPGNQDKNPLTQVQPVPPMPGNPSWEQLPVIQETPLEPAYDGTINVSGTPAVIIPGEFFTLVFRAHNTGKTSWTFSSVLIKGFDDASLFGPSEILIPEEMVILSGQDWKSSLSLTAPREPGSYRLKYSLVFIARDKQGGEFYVPFGQPASISVVITQATSPPLHLVPENIPGGTHPMPDHLQKGGLVQENKKISPGMNKGSREMDFFAMKEKGTGFSLAVKKRSGVVQEFLR